MNDQSQTPLRTPALDALLDDLRAVHPSAHIVLYNAYGWDFDETSEFTADVVDNAAQQVRKQPVRPLARRAVQRSKQLVLGDGFGLDRAGAQTSRSVAMLAGEC